MQTSVPARPGGRNRAAARDTQRLPAAGQVQPSGAVGAIVAGVRWERGLLLTCALCALTPSAALAASSATIAPYDADRPSGQTPSASCVFPVNATLKIPATGRLLAQGGNGSDGSGSFANKTSGGGGGGSGGPLFLNAPTVSPAGSFVSTRGGSGGWQPPPPACLQATPAVAGQLEGGRAAPAI